jgi:hypothetical protein
VADETIVVHGTSCQLEDTRALGPTGSVDRRGWGTILRGSAPQNTNPCWVHFSIPTALHTESRRLDGVFLCFRTVGGVAIRKIHLWDGATRFFADDNKYLDGSFDKPIFVRGSLAGAGVALKPARKLVNGLGISIGIYFPFGLESDTEGEPPNLAEITLISAGARFGDGPAVWGPLKLRRR